MKYYCSKCECGFSSIIFTLLGHMLKHLFNLILQIQLEQYFIVQEMKGTNKQAGCDNEKEKNPAPSSDSFIQTEQTDCLDIMFINSTCFMGKLFLIPTKGCLQRWKQKQVESISQEYVFDCSTLFCSIDRKLISPFKSNKNF